jgi:hypothetical protein
VPVLGVQPAEAAVPELPGEPATCVPPFVAALLPVPVAPGAPQLFMRFVEFWVLLAGVAVVPGVAGWVSIGAALGVVVVVPVSVPEVPLVPLLPVCANAPPANASESASADAANSEVEVIFMPFLL